MKRTTSSRLFVAAALLAGGLIAGVCGPARAQEEAPPPPPGEAVEPPVSPDAPQPAPADERRYLLLPDISLIGILNGHLSNDRRDGERDRLRLDEAELAVQGDVYPGIRANAFFVFTPDEAAVEEAYLAVQNLGLGRLPLSATLGRRKVPFGRVNQLHPHSWPYVVQPYVLSNLVSGESLTGDGAYLSYLLPTRFFAQLDAGFWSGGGGHGHEEEEEHEPEEEGILGGSGAGFADRFLTLRLWTAFPTRGGELEIGGSLARGRGGEIEAEAGTLRPTIRLSGLDLSFRRAGRGASRLLLRGEYVQHRQKAGDFRRAADGLYVLADQRFDAFRSLGLRYDWSEFPDAPRPGGTRHESAVSLIGTRQLNERTYVRLQILHGNRPGKRDFAEGWVQFVFGLGPHTHTLE